jgi:hypothetical protein
MTFSDDLHADPCRRCGGIWLRSRMVKAAAVLKDVKARGRYCEHCASVVARGYLPAQKGH